MKTFKEFLIEAKEIGYKKGDRVIVNYNTAKKPEYYIGTVSMIRDGLVHVKFDDGDKGKYKPTKSKTGLIGLAKPNKKKKSAIAADKIDSWLLVKQNNKTPKKDNKKAIKSNVVQKKGEKDSSDKKEPEISKVYNNFGKILFGDFRNKYGRVSKYERDTEYEKELFSHLSKYYLENKKMPEDEIKELIKIRKYYPDILVPPKKYDKAYRKSIIKKSEIVDILDNQYSKDEELKNSDVFTNENYSASKDSYNPKMKIKAKQFYKPHNNMQSWTVNTTKAMDFVNIDDNENAIHPKKGQVEIVYEVDVDDSFFFNPEFVDDIDNYHEKEITRISLKKEIDAYYIIRIKDFFKKSINDDDGSTKWTYEPYPIQK